MKETLLNLIQGLINQKYADAKTVFWAGSYVKNIPTTTSDLDLVIIYDNLPNAYREAFMYENWRIDAFVHDVETLLYFFEKVDKPTFIPALPQMIAEGIEIPESTSFGRELKNIARDLLQKGPNINPQKLYYQRFLITDLLDDIKDPKNDQQLMASACALYEQLSQYYLLQDAQWIGSGKALARKLEEYNPEIAQQFFDAFQEIFQTGSPQKVEQLAVSIFKSQGGLLWDGFKLDAPQEWRLKKEL